MVLLVGFAGYLVGTVLALYLDRVIPDAAERHVTRRCESPHRSGLRWTGALGYAAFRGHCACGRPLPARLWYLPLLGMVAAAAIVQFAAGPGHAALVAVFSVFLLAFVAADFDRRLLPNRLMYPALILAVAVCGLWPGRSALDSLAGGLIGLAAMLGVFVVLPGFGFGDVKLSALLGLVTGAAHVVSALLIGVLAGGLSAFVLLLFRRAGRRSAMAYGPYLALGAFIGMLLR